MKSNKQFRELKLIQLEQKDAKEFRRKQWLMQNKQCAILNIPIDLKDCTVDHMHKLKKYKPGPKGRGLVRGILHFQANSLEGVIVKKFKRYGLHKYITLPEFLINMAKYLLNPPVEPKYIHWSEKPKAKTFGKREYNIIKKYYFQIHPKAKIIPPFPTKPKNIKRKNWRPKRTKKWDSLIKQAEKLKESKDEK